MSWLWPQAANAQTSPLIRLGRVLHWAFLVAALAWLVMGTMIGWDESDWGPVLVTVASISLAIASLGRGIRYILADE